MAGRPPIWAPFRQVHWLAEYEYAADGRIRDRSRNVLPEHAPGCQVVIRLASGRRQPFDKRELLALEWHGRPPIAECCVCSTGLPYRVVHLDGNRRNASRDNLRWQLDGLAAQQHEHACIDELMRERPGYVPFRRHGPQCECAKCGGSLRRPRGVDIMRVPVNRAS